MDKINETQPADRRVRANIHRTDDYERQQRLFISRHAQLIWLLFIALEALIGLRVALTLIIANPNNYHRR